MTSDRTQAPEGLQSPVDARSLPTALHPASAFAGDGRPIFPAHMRHLPASIARVASFAIAIGRQIEDRRAPHEKTVVGCEGASCSLASPPADKSQPGEVRPANG